MGALRKGVKYAVHTVITGLPSNATAEKVKKEVDKLAKRYGGRMTTGRKPKKPKKPKPR